MQVINNTRLSHALATKGGGTTDIRSEETASIADLDTEDPMVKALINAGAITVGGRAKRLDTTAEAKTKPPRE